RSEMEFLARWPSYSVWRSGVSYLENLVFVARSPLECHPASCHVLGPNADVQSRATTSTFGAITERIQARGSALVLSDAPKRALRQSTSLRPGSRAWSSASISVQASASYRCFVT